MDAAKAELLQALGDDFKRYLGLLKSWFRGVINKDVFDFEAEKLLKSEKFKLHNQFIQCLFIKCHSLSGSRSEGNQGTKETSTSTTSKAKKAKVSSSGSSRSLDRTSSPSEFSIPVPLISSSDFPPSIINTPNNGSKHESNNNVIRLTFCTSEGGLPDNFAATLRIFVNVWESGLNGMDDEAVKLINLSIRDFVKNILTAVLSFRSYCKTTSDGFKYDFGSPGMNHFQLNTYPSLGRQSSFSEPTSRSGNMSSFNYSSDSLTSSIIHQSDLLEQDVLHQVASGGSCNSLTMYRDKKRMFDEQDSQIRKECYEGRQEESINLWHLFHALKTYRNCISSNSIYTTNMTRIITRLNHNE